MKIRHIFSGTEYDARLCAPVAPDLSPCWIEVAGTRVSPYAFEVIKATTAEWDALPWYWHERVIDAAPAPKDKP